MRASGARSRVARRSTGLSGIVHVDVDDPAAAEALGRALGEIRQAGWRVATPDRDEADAAGSRAARGADLVVRRNRNRVTIAAGDGQPKRGRAATAAQTAGRADAPARDPMPSGFAILSSLGGGRIDRVLAESVTSETPVDRLLVGLNWTLVRAGELCGIARSPARGTEGARSVRDPRGFRGRPLSEVARMLLSLDPLSRSVGLAAVNAFWNRADVHGRGSRADRDGGGPPAPGFTRFAPPGDGLVVVGGFPEVRRLLPHARIIEREPAPGDIAAADADDALATAPQIAITAQTLMNASLERLLALSAGARTRMLIGPSAPLCPLLPGCGLTAISGVTVVDADRAEEFISETGARILDDGLVRPAALAS